MSLKTQIAADISSVFFNTSEMANTADLWMRDGRHLRPLYIQFQSPRREDIESKHELQVDQFEFQTPIIDAATGITLNPQRGDSWRFEDDPPLTRWDFLEIIDSDDNVFVIKAQRRAIQRAGHVAPPQL